MTPCSLSKASTRCLLQDNFLIGLYFDPEDGGDMFLNIKTI
jgi:hypothetical protein